MSRSKCFAPPIVGVRGSRSIVFIGQWENGQEKPAILVTVKMSYRAVHNFVRCCGAKSLAVKSCDKKEKYAAIPSSAAEVWALVEEHGTATFEVCGDLESLEYLTGHPSVSSWQYLEKTAASVGMGRGQGQCKK